MVAEFIAQQGVLKGLILTLEQGEEWIIGRDPDLCSVVIEDTSVARQHMKVRLTDQGYVVESLSETNPILISGIPISAPTLLHEGDLLSIGSSIFRFYPEGAPASYGFEVEHDFSPAEDDWNEEPKPEEVSEQTPEPEEAPEPEQTPEPEETPEPELEDLQEPPQEEASEELEPIFSEEISEDDESEIFEEPKLPDAEIDLTQTTRFIIKVIAGPNTGAEIALDTDHQYLIGTDSSTCDIVLNDLSVSREHARVFVSPEGKVSIQDLGSRNGVVVDKERIIGIKTLSPNSVVILGTSAFLLIDRESPSETIAAPVFETPQEEEEELAVAKEEASEQVRPSEVQAITKPAIPAGALVLALIIAGLAILFGIGMVSLFKTQEIVQTPKDYPAEIQEIIKQYPAVRFTFNKSTGKIFLLGHVKTGIEHNELLYQLKGLGFISGIDDNIVNDEAVWQEMNLLTSKNPDFRGVSIHSPEAGLFVVTGYLQTEKQAADLSDYLNLNFNYLNLLQNRVVVEESIVEEVTSQLVQQGFSGITPVFTNGDLQLTGYISSNQTYAFEKLVEEFKKVPGIRSVRNFVVTVTPEQGVMDLNRKYLNRYNVTGYSRHGDININVVINGKILTRGDCIDGFTITSIQPHAIFLEKDGLKYKIEYNKCVSG